MTNQQKPEALRLADIADDEAWAFVIGVRKEIATELRRLHAENERLAALVEAQQPAPSAAAAPDDKVPEAWTNLLAYVLQDDLHNRLTPRIIDIAYTAFMQAKRPNDEDGGASDWFNDTRPMVRELIAKLRKDLVEELAGAPKPSPTPQADSAPSAAAPVGEAPLPLLVRDIAADLGTTPIQVCTALAQLGFGGHSVNMAVTPRMAKSLRAYFASTTPQADSQPAPDPADIIACALQISRGHAYDIMATAIAARKEGNTP